ncbi:MAG: anti-sigma factor antagonist [Chloroflexi bacterium]|nr:MAG: anti-sigma factor antagonist [Chloroflexota bacterium]
MQATISSGTGWELVRLGGDITSADISKLEDILQRFLTVGRYNVILELAGVTFVGSAGISLLLRYTSAFRRWERGDLHLAAMPATIRNLFLVTGLISEDHSFFSIYPTVEAAIETAQKRASQ